MFHLVVGRMASIIYQQILRKNITPSVKKMKIKRGRLLHQDNDPKNNSKSTMNNFERFKVKVVPLPSHSPDLNVTENLWIDLQTSEVQCMQHGPGISQH